MFDASQSWKYAAHRIGVNLVIRKKMVLITGAARRIGAHIAEKMAYIGHDIFITYKVSEKEANQLKEYLEERYKISVKIIKCDITKEEDVISLAHTIRESESSLTHLINNADSLKRNEFPSSDINVALEIIDTTLLGTYRVCNYICPLISGENPSIINILDTSVGMAKPDYIAHSIAKAGLMNLTLQLSVKLAPKIRVNSLVLGFILASSTMNEDKIAELSAENLLRRAGGVKEVGRAVQFLAESSFITGQNIVIDGGQMLYRKQL